MPRKKKTEEVIIETTEVIEEKEPVFKTVSNCKKLNIRKDANSSGTTPLQKCDGLKLCPLCDV